MASQDTPTNVTYPRSVDLGGDTNLVVGPSGVQVSIRVCKALMCLASSYFNALFRHDFKESGTAAQCRDIVLLEDEPDALVNLCKILHMQYTWPKPMNSTELLHLGIVADKHSCVKAIHLAIEALFPVDIAKLDCNATRDLIVAAYLLDHASLFNTYTNLILTAYLDPLTDLAFSEIGRRIPVRAWFCLEARRSEILRKTMGSIVALLKRSCPADFRNCQRIGDWYSKITSSIRSAGLDNRLNLLTSNISQLISMAETISVPTLNSSTAQCGTVVNPTAPQPLHPSPMSNSEFKAVLKECRNKCKELCLDCVRAGGTHEGKCRIQHI